MLEIGKKYYKLWSCDLNVKASCQVPKMGTHDFKKGECDHQNLKNGSLVTLGWVHCNFEQSLSDQL